MRSRWIPHHAISLLWFSLLLVGCGVPEATSTEQAAQAIPTEATQFPRTVTATATPAAPPGPTTAPSSTAKPSPTSTSVASSTPSPTPILRPASRLAATEGAGRNETVVHPPFIAYTQITETGPEIYVMDTSTDPPRTFTSETPGLALRPRWSPDMRFIAYLYQDSETEPLDVWVIDIDEGAQSRPVTTGGYGGGELSWSADGRFLVYHVANDANTLDRDIFRLDVESGETVNLTTDSHFWDSNPAWSPNGEWIAFVSDRTEGTLKRDNIWVMVPDGSGLQQLTDTDCEDVHPGWSPHSTQVVFYSMCSPGDSERQSGVWVVNADGSEARLVSECRVLPVGLEAPAWSPDGTWIAYQSGPSSFDADMYVVPADGGEPANISNLPGHEYCVSWAPDARSLIFTNDLEGEVRLYSATPNGTAPLPLLDVGGNGFGEWAPPLPADD